MSGWDIFSSTADVVVIPTNEKGTMGAGLALAAAQRWPWVLERYKAACRLGEHRPLAPLFTSAETEWAGHATHHPWVLLTPTKGDWREPSSYDRVGECLTGLRLAMKVADAFGEKTWAIPALGCGLGGLDEGAVAGMLIRTLAGCARQIDAPWAGLTLGADVWRVGDE